MNSTAATSYLLGQNFKSGKMPLEPIAESGTFAGALSTQTTGSTGKTAKAGPLEHPTDRVGRARERREKQNQHREKRAGSRAGVKIEKRTPAFSGADVSITCSNLQGRNGGCETLVRTRKAIGKRARRMG